MTGYVQRTWKGGDTHDLADGQLADGVWKASLICATCRFDFADHCKAHPIPCCPGKCLKEITG